MTPYAAYLARICGTDPEDRLEDYPAECGEDRSRDRFADRDVVGGQEVIQREQGDRERENRDETDQKAEEIDAHNRELDRDGGNDRPDGDNDPQVDDRRDEGDRPIFDLLAEAVGTGRVVGLREADIKPPKEFERAPEQGDDPGECGPRRPPVRRRGRW